MKRRTIFGAAIGFGTLAGAAMLDARKHAIPARDPAADERFRAAQEKALAAAGVRATSRFVDVARPRLRVQVIEAGTGAPVLFVHGGNSIAAGGRRCSRGCRIASACSRPIARAAGSPASSTTGASICARTAPSGWRA